MTDRVVTNGTMTERSVVVNGKDIFVADTGAGPPVVAIQLG